MSFLKKLMKNNSNNNLNNNKNNDLSNNKIKSNNDESFKRKVERKIVLSQSDPEPILDLCECRLETITPQIQSTIKIYGKTDCRFDENLLTTFALEPINSLNGLTSIHLSNNRIHSVGQYISQLINLKELYVSHNQLSSLPDSISRLPVLKILSIRDNKFTEFPNCLTDCQSLSCIDLADNRITRLPQTLLRLKLLKSLQIEGNPVSDPPPDVCAQGLDVIMTQLYKNSRKDPEFNDNDNNCDIDWRTTVTDSTVDEKDDTIENTIQYQNYQNLKDQKKRQLIEWERNFQSSNVSDELSKESIKKDILSKLWTEQRQMSADIFSRQLKKDENRKNLLESLTQLEKHSKQLFDNLYNWEERHRNLTEILEREECQLLELMLKYDHNVDLKKNAILIAMQEMLNKESQRLALSDEIKEFNHLELRTKINQKEQLQRQAFEALQRTRDYRNQSITNQILLIENELTELTQAEMQKRDDRSDSILDDIRAQRSKLAALLAQLLSQKKEREQQLREQLSLMERRRTQVDDNDFWLVQYQCLLERQPIEAQIRQFAIEDKIGRVLIAVHKEYERISDYLSLFTDLTFDRLNSMSDKSLLHLGIDDYELCKLIRDKLDEQSSSVGASASSSSAVEHSPTAPAEGESDSVPEASNSSSISISITELTAQLSDVKLWRQTECVICFDTICDVVFLPCGHVCTCQNCSHLIHLCPLCRVSIDIKQYLST